MNSDKIKDAAEKYADELIECQSIQLYEKGWLVSVLTHFYEEFQSQQKQSAVIDNALVDKLQPDFKECRNHYDYADAVELLRNFAAQAPTKQSAVWVKASEREPEKMKQFNGKLKGKPALIEYTALIDGYITANGNLERITDVEWLDETPQKQLSDEESAAIVKELAEWSIRYPRSKTYSSYRQPQMDGELIALEERAKKWLETTNPTT